MVPTYVGKGMKIECQKVGGNVREKSVRIEEKKSMDGRCEIYWYFKEVHDMKFLKLPNSSFRNDRIMDRLSRLFRKYFI